MFVCVCVCVCVWVYMSPAGLGQSSVSYSHFSVTQQSRVCLMFQLLFQRRYAETLSTVRLHEDPAWTSTSWTCAHTHTRAHTHTHTHTHTCSHSHSHSVVMHWAPQWIYVSSRFQKIYYFHMVLIRPLTAKSSKRTTCVCVCVCVCMTMCVCLCFRLVFALTSMISS